MSLLELARYHTIEEAIQASEVLLWIQGALTHEHTTMQQWPSDDHTTHVKALISAIMDAKA